MQKKGIKYESLAPTNKAARIINGTTMHKFKASFVLAKYKDRGVKYIFIDEISMVQEQFYKFFIFLRLLCPDTKFIISGDFDQLKPVKDRVEYCDYKNSVALYELCDGRRVELSRCRRSDDTLFKMVMPENLEKIRQGEDGRYSYEGTADTSE